MRIIAIDGACRGNGKPNCISTSGCLVVDFEPGVKPACQAFSSVQVESTNQRGEISALIAALEITVLSGIETIILTDSEYIFNTLTKEWHKSWARKGWLTAEMNPVKNRDLWEIVNGLVDKVQQDVTYYHIKGHCMPFGKVTASKLLEDDPSGSSLVDAVLKKYCEGTDEAKLQHAREVFLKNSGHEIDDMTLRRFIVLNTVADAIATDCIEHAVRERS